MAAKAERLLWYFKNDVLLLIRQLFKMFPEASFFVLPFGGDKPLSISAFYVLKNMFFLVSALSDSICT